MPPQISHLGHDDRTGQRPEALAWLAIIGCAMVLQIFLSLNTRFPYVVDSGDNGSILYIIARWLDPAAFKNDALLGIDGSTSFYQAALMWPNYILGKMGYQLGLFYVLICFPIVLAQTAGFYLLGKRLFSHRGVSLALAFISVPTVFTIAGDLWGHANSPLLRSAYGAALPWLLILLIKPPNPQPYLLMTCAGFTTYLHLPSGPPIALALLIVSLFCQAPRHGFGKALLHHILAGFLYLIILAPYIALFAQTFAAGDEQSLKQFLNTPYTSVFIAFDHLISQRGVDRMATLVSRVPGLFWTKTFAPIFFGVLFILGILSLLAVAASKWTVQKAKIQSNNDSTNLPHSWTTIAFFFIAVVALAFGISGLDQLVAAAQGRAQLQIDFIRATRFFVPGAYIGFFMFVVWACRNRNPQMSKAALGVLACTSALVWLFAYPSTSHGLYRLTKGQTIEDRHRSQFGEFVLKLSRTPPPHAITPVLRYDYLSSAIRYVGFLPLTFNRKDNNFISYSGKSDAGAHRSQMDKIDAIRRARRKSKVQAALIASFTESLKSPHIIIDHRVVLDDAQQLLMRDHGFSLQFRHGEFAYYMRAT